MASNLNAVESAIEAHLRTTWTAEGEDAAAIKWPGVDFVPPQGPWMRPVVRWTDGVGETHDGLVDVRGMVMIVLYDVPGSGAAKITQLADAMRDALTYASVGGARFKVASGGRLTTMTDTQDVDQGTEWLVRTVDAVFEVTETVTI